jgi:hypothetical protein
MAGLGDLFGRNGVLEQLLLWGVVNQVISALGSPAFTALQQDVMAKNPDVVLTPDVLATAVARHLAGEAHARAEAAKSGITGDRFHLLTELARVRIQPADLAEAVLRSYLSHTEAAAQAAPQGIDAGQLKLLTDLAGDAPGADQLAAALRRGIIAAHGRGPDSTSFEQGIAETRLHNKWGPVLEKLSAVLLSPPDAASAVIRNFLPEGEAEAIVARSGVSRETFTVMRQLAGDAPGPQQLAEALRRGAIPRGGTGPASVSFVQGIAEGRLADKWAPVIEALAKLWPTPVDALEAALKGQVPAAEGKRLYERLGGDLEFYPWLLDSQGEGPTPLEAVTLANRGIIGWDGTGPGVLSFAQAVRESRFRDKWAPAYRGLGHYLPPEGLVISLLSHGVIDNPRAAEWLAKQGMDEATIADMLAEAHTEALSEYRGLTVSTVLDAFYEQIIGQPDAVTILEALHVTTPAAHLLLTFVDVRRSFAQVTAAITRIRSLFAARKIKATTARDSLGKLGVPSAQVASILATWEVENSVTVRLLTEAQIADAFALGIMDQPTALTELANIGYTPYDGWVILSLKVKTILPGRPPGGPAPPQAQVTPGTT